MLFHFEFCWSKDKVNNKEERVNLDYKVLLNSTPAFMPVTVSVFFGSKLKDKTQSPESCACLQARKLFWYFAHCRYVLLFFGSVFLTNTSDYKLQIGVGPACNYIRETVESSVLLGSAMHV